MTVTERFLKLVSYGPDLPRARASARPRRASLRSPGELVRQLQLGVTDAHADEHGYVYDGIPANCSRRIPYMGLIAHMDTSPDAPGGNIHPASRSRTTAASSF